VNLPRKQDVACSRCGAHSFFLVTNLVRAVVLRCACCPYWVEADSIADALKKIEAKPAAKEDHDAVADKTPENAG